MGQKVNPVGIRLGIVKDWDSKWYANSKDYPKYLLSDIEVRVYLFKELTKSEQFWLASVKSKPSHRIIVFPNTM